MLSLKKQIFVAIFFLILNLLSSKPVNAIATFSTDYVVTYDINENGLTHVTFAISQKNNLSTVYATSFSISLSQTSVKNITVRDAVGYISPTVSQTENITNISFDFLDKVVGKEKINKFFIEYDTTDLVVRQGSIWEINVPKLETNENTNSQQIILKVPSNFGQPAYIDPKPSRIDNGTYIFNSAALGNKSVSAVFGTTQYFKLQLTYNLENPISKELTTQIAIPPDTAYQKVFIQNISPKPESLAVDPDGNWLASYSIKPTTSLQVLANLIVKLNFDPEPEILDNKSIYTRATSLWNYEDPDVAQKATSLKTPKSIYDFVANYLSYNYGRISGQGQSITRPGASWAVLNPTGAICTEFTDLFIAIARLNNIPAREVQGYAISTNDKLKPLSLSKDVLHAWPEYYNEAKKTWVQIDPTWSNTTGGIDYFNKLDLNHIAFVKHGLDPNQPLPAGAYKTVGGGSKDIFVNVVEPIIFPPPEFSISYVDEEDGKIILLIKNISGVSGLASVSIKDNPRLEDLSTSAQIAPLSSTTIEAKVKNITNFYPETQPLIISLNGQETSLNITYKPNIPTRIIWSASVSVAIGVAAITGSIYFLRRKRKASIHW